MVIRSIYRYVYNFVCVFRICIVIRRIFVFIVYTILILVRLAYVFRAVIFLDRYGDYILDISVRIYEYVWV